MANSNQQSNILCADKSTGAIRRSNSHNDDVDFTSLPVLVMTIEIVGLVGFMFMSCPAALIVSTESTDSHQMRLIGNFAVVPFAPVCSSSK